MSEQGNQTEALPLGSGVAAQVYQRLALGEIAIFPTETFYAIGCIASSEKAVEKIYQLKGRKQDSPLLVLISNRAMLEEYFQPLTAQEAAIAQKHWPGPLTMVLHPKANLAKNLNLQNNTIAVRMTQYQTTRDLIEAIGTPLVGTSANPSGQKAAETISEAKAYFEAEVGLFLDGGKAKGGLPTTLIQVENEQVQILRQGQLHL